jgi:antitoxin component YwqK of YwqJK toxin-antitoxin module
LSSDKIPSLNFYIYKVRFCRFVQCKQKNGKETLEVPSKDTDLSQCILVEYTGIYEGFHENGSLEINAEFVNGLLHGRFIHLNNGI